MLIIIQHQLIIPASIGFCLRDPPTKQLRTNPNFRGDMRDRPTRLSHQPHGLSPELRSEFPTLARHTDILPA
jgi:hypothetical protein